MKMSPTRDLASLLSLPKWDTLVVTGPERCTWLDGLVTCDVKALSPGTGNWGLVLNRQGKIQTVVLAIQSSDTLWLAVSPGTGETVLAELDRMLIMEDAEIALSETPQTWFLLFGSEALQVAEKIQTDNPNSNASCAPLDLLGLGGAVMRVPCETAARFSSSISGLSLSEQAWTQLRLERSFPLFDVDITSSDRPHEAGLERRAVCWTKGCYLGQEVVCTQDMRGKVRRSSRVLAVQAPAACEFDKPLAITDSKGTAVGTVTSLAYSNRANCWLMMARLKMDKTQDEMFAAAADGTRVSAHLCAPL